MAHPDAKAIPKHNGKATKKTTIPAGISSLAWRKVVKCFYVSHQPPRQNKSVTPVKNILIQDYITKPK